jgi:MFS family permease
VTAAGPGPGPAASVCGVPHSALVRDRLTWLLYAQVSIWGYFLYGFGPVVPLLRDEQHTSRGVASLHGTALAVGGVVGGALLPWAVRRYGRAAVIWGGLAGVAVSAAALWVSHPLWATLTWAAIASVAGSMIVNGTTAVLADHHGPGAPAALSEAHAAGAGIGLLGPLAVGATVTAGLGWRPGLGIVIGLIGLTLLGVRVRIPAGAAVGVRRVASGRPPRLPRLYWLAWTSLFATAAVEMCLNLWVPDVLRTHAHVPPGVATAAVSTIIGGMLVGRLAGGRLALRYPPAAVLLCALGVSGTGFALFWAASSPWLAMAGLAVCGLGNSVHFPMGIGLAVTHSDGRPEQALSRLAYAFGLSFGAAPFVLGAVADVVGPHTAILLVAVLLAVSATAVATLLLTTPRQRHPVGDGQQDGLDPAVRPDEVVEGDDGPGVRVVGGEDAAVA